MDCELNLRTSAYKSVGDGLVRLKRLNVCNHHGTCAELVDANTVAVGKMDTPLDVVKLPKEHVTLEHGCTGLDDYLVACVHATKPKFRAKSDHEHDLRAGLHHDALCFHDVKRLVNRVNVKLSLYGNDFGLVYDDAAESFTIYDADTIDKLATIATDKLADLGWLLRKLAV